MDDGQGAGFSQLDALIGFERALDVGYARVRRAAHITWEHYFADDVDPSDAVVAVRIATQSAERTRGSAFLDSPRRPSKTRRLSSPRFAD
jgi:hypothetical protein